MKTLKIIPFAFFLSSFLLCGKVEESVPDDNRQLNIQEKIASTKTIVADPERAADLWDKVCYTPDGYDIVYFFDFIIEACALGWNDSYVKTTLEKIIAVQVQSGNDLGKIPRYLTASLDYSDRNNIEFGLELSTLALIEFYNSWSAETKALFDDFIDKALYACWEHDNVAVTYTNIFVMRAWNLIALGENLDSGRTWGDSYSLTTSQIAQAGYDLLDRLYTQTTQYGFHEFNSPTYTGVQAECIGYLANYTKNAARREKALKMREYLSAILCANYFNQASVLTGPMSRCYNRGFSSGQIDQLAGGMLMGKSMYAYNRYAAWKISEKYLKINRQFPRMAAWIFGDATDAYTDGKTYFRMNALNYVDRFYSVSSAGSHYTGNGIEKTVTIAVSTENHPCNINFAHYMEGRGDPYGFLPGTSTHVWTCFRDAYARSQHNNEIVWMQAGNCTDNPHATNMCSHVIVPMTNVDEIWVDDTKLIDWESSPQGTTFFFRIDHVVVTIKYLYTFGTDGSDKSHTLIYDSEGLRNYYVLSDGQRHYAMRITTELSPSVPSSTQIAGVAMYWRADDCIYSERQFRELRQMMLNLDVHAPEQKVYIAGDSSTDTFYCYVNTPEGRKLGINGHFVLKNYYNRFIYDDKMPEYLSSKNWYYNQSAVYGQSIDFSNPCRSFLSVDGWDIGNSIFNKQHN